MGPHEGVMCLEKMELMKFGVYAASMQVYKGRIALWSSYEGVV